jgi:hypothetical protein
VFPFILLYLSNTESQPSLVLVSGQANSRCITISSVCRVNLSKRMFDKILYEVNKGEIPRKLLVTFLGSLPCLVKRDKLTVLTHPLLCVCVPPSLITFEPLGRIFMKNFKALEAVPPSLYFLSVNNLKTMAV